MPSSARAASHIATLPPHRIEQLIPANEIATAVRRLGEQIAADYPDDQIPVVLIGVLSGAAIFLSDLARAIPRPVEYDFVQFSSYGSGTESTGTVRLLKDFSLGVSGKHVVVVEDILDTGLTLAAGGLIERLHTAGAASVRVCVLLNKPARRRSPVTVDYCGFEIDDHFVVGYGLDYAQQYRNLPYVGLVIHDDACA